jgi:hypothetical protein
LYNQEVNLIAVQFPLLAELPAMEPEVDESNSLIQRLFDDNNWSRQRPVAEEYLVAGVLDFVRVLHRVDPKLLLICLVLLLGYLSSFQPVFQDLLCSRPDLHGQSCPADLLDLSP